MSRTSPTPPPAAGDPNRRPTPTGPGMPAQKPGVTPPMAPPVGQSAPPNRAGQPADRAHSGAGNGTGARPPAAPTAPAPTAPAAAAATPGMPPIDQLQGRPIG